MNDFLFEHTSKISLEDIKEAKRKEDEAPKKKALSPYTKIPKKKVDFRPALVITLIVLIVFFVIYLLLKRDPNENNLEIELQTNGNLWQEAIYE
ncbi:MAG: hypothetical protein RSE56_03855 [Bacilli bacterium]